MNVMIIFMMNSGVFGTGGCIEVQISRLRFASRWRERVMFDCYVSGDRRGERIVLVHLVAVLWFELR